MIKKTVLQKKKKKNTDMPDAIPTKSRLAATLLFVSIGKFYVISVF